MTDPVPGAPDGAPAGTVPPSDNTPPVRPDNVPEKFWNAESGAVDTDALLTFYTDAEAARVAAEEAAANAPPPVDKAAKFVELSEKATEELAQNGVVSEETYAAYAADGVTREQVDLHIEGQHARFELRKIHAEREAGGEDEYSALLAWAGANYTPEEATAYNDTVFGPSKDSALQAVRALKTRYEAAMGTEGKIVTPGTTTGAPGGYTMKSEWLSDIRDPKYKSDPTFQDAVRRKLEVALKNGVNMGVSISVG